MSSSSVRRWSRLGGGARGGARCQVGQSVGGAAVLGARRASGVATHRVKYFMCLPSCVAWTSLKVAYMRRVCQFRYGLPFDVNTTCMVGVLLAAAPASAPAVTCVPTSRRVKGGEDDRDTTPSTTPFLLNPLSPAPPPAARVTQAARSARRPPAVKVKYAAARKTRPGNSKRPRRVSVVLNRPTGPPIPRGGRCSAWPRPPPAGGSGVVRTRIAPGAARDQSLVITVMTLAAEWTRRQPHGASHGAACASRRVRCGTPRRWGVTLEVVRPSTLRLFVALADLRPDTLLRAEVW